MNADQSPVLSPNARLFRVITDPGLAFESTAQRPFPWLALILAVVLVTVAAFLTIDVSMEVAREATIEAMVQRGQDATDAERVAEQAAGFQRIGSLVGPAIGMPIVLLISALIYWGAGNVFFGNRAPFLALFEMVSVTGLVQAIGGILRVPLVLSSRDAYATLGLGAFVDSSSTLYPILAMIDPFSVWALCLAAIGLGRIYRVPTQRGAILATAMWVLGIVIFGGGGALFRGMGG